MIAVDTEETHGCCKLGEDNHNIALLDPRNPVEPKVKAFDAIFF